MVIFVVGGGGIDAVASAGAFASSIVLIGFSLSSPHPRRFLEVQWQLQPPNLALWPRNGNICGWWLVVVLLMLLPVLVHLLPSIVLIGFSLSSPHTRKSISALLAPDWE